MFFIKIIGYDNYKINEIIGNNAIPKREYHAHEIILMNSIID